MLMRKKTILIVLISVFLLIAFLCVSVICWVNYRIASIKPSSFQNDISTPLLLSHRGYSKTVPDNSIESVGAALDMGFRGVEIDYFYYPDKGLVVQHDCIDEEKGKVPKKVLFLDDLLEKFKDEDVFYWLDTKNLSTNNAKDVASKIAELMKRYGLEKKVLLESANPSALAMVRDAIPEIYVALTLPYSSKPVKHFVCDLILKFNLAIYKFDIISLWHLNYREGFHDDYSNITVIIWTVNNTNDFLRIRDLNPAIVLTDENWTDEFPELYNVKHTEKD